MLSHVEYHNEKGPTGVAKLLRYTEMFGGRKLRVRVSWDRSYPHQSSAEVHHWDGVQWQQVAYLLPHTVTDLDDTEDLVLAIASAVLYRGDDGD